MPSKFMIFFFVLLLIGLIYMLRKHQEEQKKWKREMKRQEQEEEEMLHQRQRLLAEEQRARAAEQRLAETQAKAEEEAKRKKAMIEQERRKEIARREAEIEEYAAEERRQGEVRRMEFQNKIDTFIDAYMRPLVEGIEGKRPTFDEDIVLKRRIFGEGTRFYRINGFYDNFAFQEAIAGYLKRHGIDYYPGRDTPYRFSCFEPHLRLFEKHLLEYAAIDYFYARKSGHLHYGNLKGNRDLGVDIILSDDERCFLVSCLRRKPGSETIDIHAMINHYENLEVYSHDFLPQSYPDLTSLKVRFMLILGRSGTDGLTPEAYTFAKEKFHRILTLQNLVDFLDFNAHEKKAHHKYMDPIIPEKVS